MCGRKDIDLEMLKRHTEYANVDRNAPHIEYFWRVLESFTPEERRRFVRFCYAQERLPSTDEQFNAHPKIRLLIKASREKGNPDAALPHADTCFFNLELPAYSSEQIMRERLSSVINVDWGMSGDDDPGMQGMEALLRVNLPPADASHAAPSI
eukprot:TRINITY_DN2513_c0_g1_i3.p1 TRINITY_DN2513_c0_g1~~TRINITY_DN2513_c0_g1_i3.p1  ORF type:complete len:153 (-),score=46.11 TRINITY_DN2513_c0_g1_i3:70-528(-)